jgi:hypothetical protein
VDPAGYLKTDLADDGLHPNSAGYRVMGPIALDAIDRNIARPAGVAAPAAITSSSRKRTTTVRAPKPAPEPVEEVQAPAAAPKPVTPARKRPTPVADKPAAPVKPAVAPPAPVAETPAPTAPTPATAETKPAAVTDTNTQKTKKKESFWKRTYPTTPPATPPKQ